MNELKYQTTAHLLILIKAIKEHNTTGIDHEKNSLVTEIIKILSSRIKHE